MAVVLTAFLALASTAGAATLSLAPSGHGKGMLVFDLGDLGGTAVRSAVVRGPGVRRKLSTRRVGRASRRGVVRVRGWSPRPARHRAGHVAAQRRAWRDWRLLLVVPILNPAPDPDPGAGPAPAPEARPNPACAPAFGTFTAGQWPPGCWRPYSSDSPFNKPIPANPRLHPNSDAIVERLTGFGPPHSLLAGAADTTWDYYRPVYYSRPGDPDFEVNCTMYGGACPIDGHRIRIPDRARPAGGTDHHLTVVDQSSGFEYDFWNVQSKPSGGGTLEVGWGGRTRIDGDGRESGGTAAEFGGLAGMIRAQEMEAGRIDHALFMVVKCVTDSPQYVYPATKEARYCPDRTNAPATGQHFQLAMSRGEIDALAVPGWKKTILHAMAEYGMFVGDTGGSSWGLQFESGSTYTSFGHDDPMVAFAQQKGVPDWGTGRYWFSLREGLDWRQRLQVIDPCVSEGSAPGRPSDDEELFGSIQSVVSGRQQTPPAASC